jgi:hypothetical protein
MIINLDVLVLKFSHKKYNTASPDSDRHISWPRDPDPIFLTSGIRIPHPCLQRYGSPVLCFWFPDLHPFLTSGIPHTSDFSASGIQIVTIFACIVRGSRRSGFPGSRSIHSWLSGPGSAHFWVSGAGFSHFWVLGFGFLHSLLYKDPDPPVLGILDPVSHILGFQDLDPHNIDFWNPRILSFWDPDPYILDFGDPIFKFWTSGIWIPSCFASRIRIPTYLLQELG